MDVLFIDVIFFSFFPFTCSDVFLYLFHFRKKSIGESGKPVFFFLLLISCSLPAIESPNIEIYAIVIDGMCRGAEP